jgi:hypothetical protein
VRRSIVGSNPAFLNHTSLRRCAQVFVIDGAEFESELVLSPSEGSCVVWEGATQ